jgi:hypothetical protein
VIVAKVADAVNRIQAERVNVKFGQPVDRILDKEAPHGFALWAVEINGFAPGGPIAVREVRPKVGEVISFGPEVIVDDVEHNREPFTMTGVYQCL